MYIPIRRLCTCWASWRLWWKPQTCSYSTHDSDCHAVLM